MTPRWRWWLFCASLSVFWNTNWRWTRRLMGWSVLPEWNGAGSKLGEEKPF
jgi:hypothetical protein